MANYTVVNVSNSAITGSSISDRLIFTYNTTTNDVWLTSIAPAPLGGAFPQAGGYSGTFNGMGSNDCNFSGIEAFTFTDLSGGNDIIRTGDGNDVLIGGAGNDTLAGAGGIDKIDGGEGNDQGQMSLSWATQAISINLNGTSTFLGTGVLKSIEGIDVSTGTGNDAIAGHRNSGMPDTVSTGKGNDLIKLWMGGTDFADGGAGNDLLAVTYDIQNNDVWLQNLTGTLQDGYSGTFNGLGSNDLSFSGIERFSFTDVSAGNDIITTGDGNDTLSGGPGDDVLRGNGGIDIVDGGAGNDRWGGNLASTTQNISINLNSASTFLGKGSLQSIEGIDLSTGAGNDVIVGHRTSRMADNIGTGQGNDFISLWMGGTESVDGGAGQDLLTVVYDIETNDVWLQNLSGTLQSGYSGTFNGLGSNDLNFSGVERFSFTDKSGGNDIINTGDGNDTLNGGAGVDTLAGAGGNDVYYVDNADDQLSELIGQGTDSVNSSVNYTLQDNFENLALTGTALNGIGNAAGNILIGNAGNNTLQGLEGDDMLVGNDGADNLRGGSGNDLLSGGKGADKFFFDAALNAATNRDTLKDFAGGSDKIVLDDDVFKVGVTGNNAGLALSASSFYSGASAHDADDRIVYDNNAGKLYYDADGSGTAAQPIQFALVGTTTHQAVTAADFLVIA